MRKPKDNHPVTRHVIRLHRPWELPQLGVHLLLAAMQPAKKMRRSSTDEWPLEAVHQVDEGPFLKFPNSETTRYADAQIMDSGVAYTIPPETYKFNTDTFQLSQLSVIKLKGEFYRAVQLNSDALTVYMVISADDERSLIQKHVRLLEKKVNYRLWYDNSISQKRPNSQADRALFGNICFLSSPLCNQLRIEKIGKGDKRPKASSKQPTVSIKVNVNTEITLSNADAIGLLNGTKKLIVADK